MVGEIVIRHELRNSIFLGPWGSAVARGKSVSLPQSGCYYPACDPVQRALILGWLQTSLKIFLFF